MIVPIAMFSGLTCRRSRKMSLFETYFEKNSASGRESQASLAETILSQASIYNQDEEAVQKNRHSVKIDKVRLSNLGYTVRCYY